MRIAGDAFEILQIAALAHQQAQVRTFVRQRMGHMMAHKTGRALRKTFMDLLS